MKLTSLFNHLTCWDDLKISLSATFLGFDLKVL